jgi:hypothetical protein
VLNIVLNKKRKNPPKKNLERKETFSLLGVYTDPDRPHPDGYALDADSHPDPAK